MDTISNTINFFGHTQTETISTRNSIAIINHFSFNSLNCFIIATKTYLCLYVSILWSDLKSSRMCLWNKIPIPLFGARFNVYHPCFWSMFASSLFNTCVQLPKNMFVFIFISQISYKQMEFTVLNREQKFIQ